MINAPGWVLSEGTSINDAGQVVGIYKIADKLSNLHGFLYNGGNIVKLDVPGSSSTYPKFISQTGDIYGTYDNDQGQYSFVLSAGKYRTIVYPGGDHVIVNAANSHGVAVGSHFGGYPDYAQHAFTLSNGKFRSVEPPGADSSSAYAVNDSGSIAGFYYDRKGPLGHAYVAVCEPAGASCTD